MVDWSGVATLHWHYSSLKRYVTVFGGVGADGGRTFKRHQCYK